MKFSVVLSGNLFPCIVDDHNATHEAALIIEDDNFRVVLGLDNDKDVEKKHTPYWSRVLTLEKAIALRNALTDLINFHDAAVQKKRDEL